MVLRVRIPKWELEEITKLVKPLGFKNGEQFVESAAHEKLLALKKSLFLRNAKEIRDGLRKSGITVADLLQDFEKVRIGALRRS